MDSYEAELVAILEALCLFVSSYQVSLVAESDSSNAIKWVSSLRAYLVSSKSP